MMKAASNPEFSPEQVAIINGEGNDQTARTVH
jgi:hypothetical protein